VARGPPGLPPDFSGLNAAGTRVWRGAGIGPPESRGDGSQTRTSEPAVARRGETEILLAEQRLAAARVPAMSPSMADARPTRPRSRPTGPGRRRSQAAGTPEAGRRTAVVRARRSSTRRGSRRFRAARRAASRVPRASARTRVRSRRLADLLRVGRYPGRDALAGLERPGLIVPFDGDRLAALASGRRAGSRTLSRGRIRGRRSVRHAG
jgi:hypothetical protein